MSHYPDFNNKEHRDAVARNLGNAGNGVIEDACDMIEAMEKQLARLTRENEELRAERDKWKSEWAAAIVAIVGIHRLTSEAHAELERTSALMNPTPGGPNA